jgi:hypothetical protein
MGGIIITYTIFVGKCEGQAHLVDLNEDGRVILKYIIKKQVVRVWTEFIWLRISTTIGLL